MSKFSVTVVIPVWNEWHHTKACLETLRPTLGINDEVVIVDNGSEDGTKAGLKHYPWAKIITNEVNLGFAKACNQGAQAATKDIVIFLNNDTLVPSKWMEGLVAPFADAGVVATGPRSNAVSGPQVVADCPYQLSPMSSFRNWARDWREEHRGLTTSTNRLVGFCLAVRREDFATVGGFDEAFGIGGFEDDDLCRRLAEMGQLLICHDSFVHHEGHVTFDGNGLDWMEIQADNAKIFAAKHNVTLAQPTRPLLSASLIMKDEAENLSRCLTSLNGLVDEVIIYDTGSTDGSIEMARKAGATVIEGYWDDDFGRARNASLAACSGLWTLQIDVDEEFTGNPATWRTLLEAPSHSAYLVDILNLSDGGKRDMTHQAARLFRTELWTFVGRLHEQIVPRSVGRSPECGALPSGQLIHHGYLSAAMEAKDKAARNLRIAQLANAEMETGDQMEVATNLGRSFAMALRHEEALVQYRIAKELPTESVRVRRSLIRSAALACLSLERPADALVWLEELDALSERKGTLRYFQGLAYGDMGEHSKTIAVLEGLTALDDEDGMQYPMWQAQVRLAMAYEAQGNWAKAASSIALAALETAHDEPIWVLVVDSHYKAGMDLKSLLSRVDPRHLNAIFGQLQGALPQAADAALDALIEAPGALASVMALAIRVAPHLSIERALEWSARLREVQMAQHCPVLAQARDESRPALERLTALAAAFAAFDDPRAEDIMADVAPLVPETAFAVALLDLQNLAPALLLAFVEGAATTAVRSTAMGKALYELGADEEGVVVALLALEQGIDNAACLELAQWLESVGHDEEALKVRAKA